jgi:hypothetical protein
MHLFLPFSEVSLKRLGTFLLLAFSLAAFADPVEAPTMGTVLSVGPAAGSYQGGAGFGAMVGITQRWRDALPLYVGVESGFVHYNPTAGTFNNVPLLLDIFYKFECLTVVKPYLGVTAGVAFDFYPGGGSPELDFEGLVKIGVEVPLTAGLALFAEPRFGLINGNFLFAPTVGVNLAL